jgi:hypothetical protein
MSNQDLFQAQAISEPGADGPGDCLSQFSQVVDGAWFIQQFAANPSPVDDRSPPNNVNTNTSAANFQACVAQCVDPCMFATVSTRAGVMELLGPGLGRACTAAGLCVGDKAILILPSLFMCAVRLHRPEVLHSLGQAPYLCGVSNFLGSLMR